MCGTWLAINTGRKNHHLCTIAQVCWAISSQLRHVSTIGKNLLNGNYIDLLHMSLQYSELRMFNGCDLLASLRHPSKFQRVLRFGFVTAATLLNGSQPNFALCSAISWPGKLYIHFRQLLPPEGILPLAKFTLCPSTYHRTSLSKMRAIPLQLRHVWTIGKKLLNSNTSSTCPHNMVNFGSLMAEICW